MTGSCDSGIMLTVYRICSFPRRSPSIVGTSLFKSRKALQVSLEGLRNSLPSPCRLVCLRALPWSRLRDPNSLEIVTWPKHKGPSSARTCLVHETLVSTRWCNEGHRRGVVDRSEMRDILRGYVLVRNGPIGVPKFKAPHPQISAVLPRSESSLLPHLRLISLGRDLSIVLATGQWI